MKDLRHSLAVVLIALFAASCMAGAPPDGAAGEKAAAIAKEIGRTLGTSWYGVYFTMGGGQKCGFAQVTTSKGRADGEDVYVAVMAMEANINMMGATQKIRIGETRRYRMTGELSGFETDTKSVLGDTKLSGTVKGDKLIVSEAVGGQTRTRELPVPGESLDSVLAGRRLMDKGGLNATVEYEVFEATMSKSIHVTAKLLRFEERLLGGVKTRVAVLENSFKELGMTSTDYVTEAGDLIETAVGGMFILRKEPERVAKDVRFAFDAMRAGIITVKEALGDPRRLESMDLKVSGVPLAESLIDDGRQKWTRGGAGKDAVHGLSLRRAAAPKEALQLPLKLGPDEKEIGKYLEATTFEQSDAPEMVKKAKEIVGDEQDAFKAASKIEAWVYANVKKKGLAAMSNALDVLHRMEGDCSEHSVLFVALCRAAGIPARQAVGVGYSDSMKGFGYHAWGEVYVGSWVAMDPTWGETLADASHVKFGAGAGEAMGVVAGLFGSLKIEVLKFERK